MVRLLLIIFQTFLLLVFSSCNQVESDKLRSDKNVAYIDSIPITINQVDNKVKQEIYDELSRIYMIRKIALDEVIKENLLSLEASKKRLTVDILLDSLYQNGIRNTNKLQAYINHNQYNKGIPSFERTLRYYDINLPQGQEILIKRYKEILLNDYIDSLKTVYKTRILLESPIPPTIKMESLLTHYRGNLESKVTLLVISDFECEMCRKFNPVFDSLYFKYKDKVRFGYTNFGSYVTLSAIASECAAKQDRFWEMHDFLFSSSSLPDTAEIFRMAYDCKLNSEKFRKDFNDENLRAAIERNITLLMNVGIYATPTIMINNKPIFNSSSINEIEQILLKEILKPI